MHSRRAITIAPDGVPGTSVAFVAATGLVPGAVNVICTVWLSAVLPSVWLVAVKVTGPPCWLDRTVNLAWPLLSVTTEAGDMVTPLRTGLPATLIVLTDTPLPLMYFRVAVSVAKVVRSAALEM